MAVNFPKMVYLPAFKLFARPIIVRPVASQPDAPPYTARGIFDTEDIDIETLDGTLYERFSNRCENERKGARRIEARSVPQ
jgi:hypothetical protein